MGTVRLLLEPGLAPFSMALALVAGLLLLEIVFGLIGLSLMGGADGPDLDGPVLDAPNLDAAPHLDAPDLHAGADLGAGHFNADAAPDAHGAGPAQVSGGGVAGWLGFGQVPAVLWLAGMLTAFGIAGYVLQLVLASATGLLLPAWAAALLALPPAVVAGRWFARGLARIVPKTESSAISRRSLGDRVGVVVQGTARRGRPAQARVRDGHGNLHYVRIEPIDDDGEIAAGTEIIILSGRTSVLKAIPVTGTSGEETI